VNHSSPRVPAALLVPPADELVLASGVPARFDEVDKEVVDLELMMEMRACGNVEIGLEALSDSLEVKAAISGHDPHTEFVKDVVVRSRTFASWIRPKRPSDLQP
jgi:hypothetical protein